MFGSVLRSGHPHVIRDGSLISNIISIPYKVIIFGIVCP